jgi:hypothetical protein
MNNEELLEQLGKLIKAEGEAIRKDVVTKRDLETNNKVIGTIFRVETAELKQGQKRIEQQLVTKVRDHEERITRLEETADLTHKN